MIGLLPGYRLIVTMGATGTEGVVPLENDFGCRRRTCDRGVLVAYLCKAGFEVKLAVDGRQALELFWTEPPALILLDVMSPYIAGWEVLRRIRETSSCPIIILTALGGIDDRLSGLNGGADDYMPKPFIPEEVVARVQAVLRRPSQWTDGGRQRRFGRLSIDFLAQSVSLNGAEVILLPRDLAVLLFLAEHPNRTFTRDQPYRSYMGFRI